MKIKLEEYTTPDMDFYPPFGDSALSQRVCRFAAENGGDPDGELVIINQQKIVTTMLGAAICLNIPHAVKRLAERGASLDMLPADKLMELTDTADFDYCGSIRFASPIMLCENYGNRNILNIIAPHVKSLTYRQQNIFLTHNCAETLIGSDPRLLFKADVLTLLKHCKPEHLKKMKAAGYDFDSAFENFYRRTENLTWPNTDALAGAFKAVSKNAAEYASLIDSRALRDELLVTAAVFCAADLQTIPKECMDAVSKRGGRIDVGILGLKSITAIHLLKSAGVTPYIDLNRMPEECWFGETSNKTVFDILCSVDLMPAETLTRFQEECIVRFSARHLKKLCEHGFFADSTVTDAIRYACGCNLIDKVKILIDRK